jgi:hypothetical protein
MPEYEKRSGMSDASGAARAPQPTPGKRTLVEQAHAPVVQRRATGASDEAQVHAAATRGVATPASPLPHADLIQRAFGRHDITSVQAHTGPAAAVSAQAMGAGAYATGSHVVLGDQADLFTVAHEAAHVVQQRGGVQLRGGVGQAGDPYERHADEVASLVVQGRSAEGTLDAIAGGTGASATPAIQRVVGQDPESSFRPNLAWATWFQAMTQDEVRDQAQRLGLDGAALKRLGQLLEDHGQAGIKIPAEYGQARTEPGGARDPREEDPSGREAVGSLLSEDQAAELLQFLGMMSTNATGSSQSGPSQSGPSQSGPSQSGPSQPGPSQPGPSQPGPSQPGPSQPGPSEGAPPRRDWEVFRMRAANWNSSGAYGSSSNEERRQIDYGERCLAVVDDAVRMAQEGSATFQQVLAFIAEQRQQIAFELGHQNAAEFGKPRKAGPRGEPGTPITGRYREYGKRIDQKYPEGTTSEGSGGTQVSATRSDIGLDLTTSADIGGEEVTLTGTMLDRDFSGEPGEQFEQKLAAYEEQLKEWKRGGKAGSRPRDTSGAAPGLWIHTRAADVPRVLAKARGVYDQAMTGTLELVELQRKVAELHWWLAHAMPYQRGSAAIADMLTKVIWRHRAVRVFRWNPGIVPDLEAFMLPLQEYVAAYGGFFERPPERESD